MRCVVFTGAGGGEVVDFQERPDPVPGSGEVLVRVRYAGLNPADLHQRAGHYPAPPGARPTSPGSRCRARSRRSATRCSDSGPVTACSASSAAGDWRIAWRCTSDASRAFPANLDELDAAAVPEAFITAHDAIRTRGRLTMGETLLVHGANGGVGTAALQIGLAAGANVLGAVRASRRRPWCASSAPSRSPITPSPTR